MPLYLVPLSEWMFLTNLLQVHLIHPCPTHRRRHHRRRHRPHPRELMIEVRKDESDEDEERGNREESRRGEEQELSVLYQVRVATYIDRESCT